MNALEKQMLIDEGRWLRSRIATAENENDFLRGVLENLLKDPPSTLDEPDDDCIVIVKMRAIIREALRRGQQQT